MIPEQIKASLGTWVHDEAFHTIAGACGDMIRAYDKVADELRREQALTAILSDALSEIKATSDGHSTQPIVDIVAWCVGEVPKLKAARQREGE